MDVAVRSLLQQVGADEQDELLEYLMSYFESLEILDSSDEALDEVIVFLDALLDGFASRPDCRTLVVATLELVRGVKAEAPCSVSSSSSSSSSSSTNHVTLLREVFPSHTLAAIEQALIRHADIYDAAAALAAAAPPPLPAASKSGAVASATSSQSRSDELDAIKAFISKRFAFDTDREVKCHRPTVSYGGKENTGKVRYLNSQVVTTRGERYTFVKTAADEEEEKRMQKTFVHLTLYTKGKRGA